jgi:1,4-dihydroxy-2-naphthoyl-CoA hydrolase
MDPQQLVAFMPFAVALGIEVHAATPELVEGSMPWAPERCTAGGILHGGALISLADTVGALCAVLNLPEGATTATTQSSTYLVRAARDGTVRASARPVNVGRTTIVVQTELRDDAGKLLAVTTQSQAVLTQN